MRAWWAALDLDMQDAHFYGGLALLAFGPTIWLRAVGAILTAHAWLTSLLATRRG